MDVSYSVSNPGGRRDYSSQIRNSLFLALHFQLRNEKMVPFPLFLQGADLVWKFYGVPKNKSMPARSNSSPYQIKHVTDIIHCRQVIGGVLLHSLVTNIVGLICSKQMHLFVQGHTKSLCLFPQISKGVRPDYGSTLPWPLSELSYRSLAIYAHFRRVLFVAWFLHHEILYLDVAFFTEYGVLPGLFSSPRLELNGITCKMCISLDLCVHGSPVINCENSFCWGFGRRKPCEFALKTLTNKKIVDVSRIPFKTF